MNQFHVCYVVLCISIAITVTTAEDKIETSFLSSILKQSSQTGTGTQPLVYSYSKIVQQKDGTSLNKMLTILTGKDGKYHYVKAEGPNVEKGIWKDNLPEMPDVDSLISEKAKELNDKAKEFNAHMSAVDALVNSFDQTVDNYLKALKE